ncbi:MAG: bifunctional phosphopantothenoylcysteine decarboxylase/phosphopantothenate--cysteine ligase CoaBC [Anaerolineae bacterium]|nr:bifunctional phosphopantothenoylcysteine decarboxylase/phosphopantothenate--cysteine ligase CoaBC [Anaerolineae bacterium]
MVLGVTGSIAAYKAADLASKLAQAGAQVDTILTAGAQHFVTPLTFQSVTGRRAHGDGDLWGSEAHVLHVGLAHGADLVVIAPATANTLAKLAHGQADNLLTVTALAASCPLLVAPAMDGGMFDHPATQANLAQLRARGVHIAGPDAGHLASGLVANGRLREPALLLGEIRRVLAADGPLAGRKVVVTAGGTREAIDPVRYLTNRSSGKQGYAVTQAALDAGADVVLISTVGLPTPAGARLVTVASAAEMADAVLAAAADADALVMAAAVADFRPAQTAAHKIKKSGDVPVIELARTTDILATVDAQLRPTGFPRVVIGFAAETQDLLANAQDKLTRKGLDAIIANDVSAADAGFGVDTNRVTILRRDGTSTQSGLVSKEEVGALVVEEIVGKLREDVKRDA